MAGSDKKPDKKTGKKPGWLTTIRQTYQIAKRNDPKIGWILLGIFVGILAIFVLGALLIPMGTITKVLVIVLGLSLALLATSFVFGRRAERAAYSEIAGQTGAAAAVLDSMRGAWFTTPAVAVTKNEDLVHQVVGRPGVILVGEGAPSRVKHLMANQRKKTERWIPDTPITEIYVGDGEGQVPLPKLQRYLGKLPKVLRPAEVTEVRRKLDAAQRMSSPVPIPKGPVPKSGRAARPPKNQR